MDGVGRGAGLLALCAGGACAAGCAGADEVAWLVEFVAVEAPVWPELDWASQTIAPVNASGTKASASIS